MLGVVAIPLLLLPGCKKESTPEPLVTVQAQHPEVGLISEHIMADAVLTPLAQAAIEPKISAPVHTFLVQRGTRVKAGQLLAVLENKDLTAAALDNKGSYVAAQAAFETATKAQVPEDMLKAESDLAQAKANLDLNQSIVKNRKQLFAEGAIPGRDLDTAQAALVQVQSAYAAAEKHYQSMRNVSREAALKSAQGQLTSAQGKYEGAEAQVNYSEIRSPIDGVFCDGLAAGQAKIFFSRKCLSCFRPRTAPTAAPRFRARPGRVRSAAPMNKRAGVIPRSTTDWTCRKRRGETGTLRAMENRNAA